MPSGSKIARVTYSSKASHCSALSMRVSSGYTSTVLACAPTV